MNLQFLSAATLVTAFFFSFTAPAAAPNATHQLQSAETIDALLDHLGLLDDSEDLVEDIHFYGNMHRRRDDRRRPPRRHYPRPRRPRNHLVTCVATNARGHRFPVTSNSAVFAQQEALRTCYRYSRRCYRSGCYFR